jgi:hypothetical protein
MLLRQNLTPSPTICGDQTLNLDGLDLLKDGPPLPLPPAKRPKTRKNGGQRQGAVAAQAGGGGGSSTRVGCGGDAGDDPCGSIEATLSKRWGLVLDQM